VAPCNIDKPASGLPRHRQIVAHCQCHSKQEPFLDIPAVSSLLLAALSIGLVARIEEATASTVAVNFEVCQSKQPAQLDRDKSYLAIRVTFMRL
jgi:hypothetical protein